MIGALRGVVIAKNSDALVLDVQGVGYELYCPASSLCCISSLGQVASVWVEHVVREDSQRLFAFATLGCKKVFQMLTAVSGIGPKAALSLLGPYTGIELCEIILRSDVKILTKIPGVGAKTAERIVLELKSKCEKIMIILASDEFGKEPVAFQKEPVALQPQNLLFEDPVASEVLKKTDALRNIKTSVQMNANKRALFSEVKSALENMGYKEKIYQDILPDLEHQYSQNSQNTLELLLRYTLRRITDRMVKVENV
jgi:holliday junction DNA helicase RuvA